MRPQYDVIIVGGGPAGLCMAQSLSRAGLFVLVLEAGRRVGGRSLEWGGWCAELDERNLRDAREMGAPWPLSLEELKPYYARARGLLNVKRGRLEQPFRKISRQLGLSVLPKSGAVHASGKRPLTALDWSVAGPRCKIRTGATVIEICASPAGEARGVRYEDRRTGRVREVAASKVVVCASALESARLLARSPELAAHIPLEHVGRGLTDHLALGYVLLVPGRAAAGRIGPLERAAYVPRFVNLDRGSRRPYGGGFLVELRGPLPLSELDDATLASLGVEGDEDLSYYSIFGLGELAPDRRRYMDFAARKPRLHWEWTAADRRLARDVAEAAEALAGVLAPSGGQLVACQQGARDGLPEPSLFHQASTCRMGRSARDSVTDAFGAVHGTRGLYVADAAVLPTALDRYPTLTVLALALRTADHMA